MEERERRRRMIESQIAARGVKDTRVLAALEAIPRELFVPDGLRHNAYDDRALPIEDSQTISQPYIVAIMTELLRAEPDHRVLEVGTGSGYQAAILSKLARQVFSIERHPNLAASAKLRLDMLGITNVEIRVGDGTLGLPEDAPFDRVLVTAGAPRVPGALTAQLAESGRLVIPVGPPGYQHLTVVSRASDRYTQQEHDACVFVPLIGEHGWAR